MRTIAVHAARDVRVEHRSEPAPPQDGQVQVRMRRGGICGSDLHYVNHGGFGTVRLREPMILGHEVAGEIMALGPGVTGLAVGQRVAVSPSRPCGVCTYCRRGAQNHCMDMRFYGSAMPFPHIQGAFREVLTADADQCIPADGLSDAEAAMAEPLSVVLHAAAQAGDLMGQRVLVTGCGPIGLLAVLVARAAGAVEVAATDIAAFPLEKARAIGADLAVNVAETPEGLSAFATDKGQFDVHFECSGVETALAAAVPLIRPRGTVVQLGLGGDMTLPMQAMTAKELTLKGSFRFHPEFRSAVQMMQSGRLDVRPLVTHVLPMDEAEAAFALAGDRRQSIKVHLDFS